MTRRNRNVAVGIILLICVSLLGAFLFVTLGAEHDCTHDDDCAVCRAIDMCIHTLRSGAALLAVLVAVFCAAAAVRAAVRTYARIVPAPTLITLRTELRN